MHIYTKSREVFRNMTNTYCRQTQLITLASEQASTYCSFVQNFDGARLSHVVLPQGLLQQLERRTLPFSKDH